MSLLTAFIVEKSHIVVGSYFIFLMKHPAPNFKGFQYQILDLSEKIGKVVNK